MARALARSGDVHGSHDCAFGGGGEPRMAPAPQRGTDVDRSANADGSGLLTPPLEGDAAGSGRFPPLPAGPYGVLYADPPWQYRNGPMMSGSHAAAHYPTVPTTHLATLAVGAIADQDAVLFLWATSPCMAEAIWLAEQWGFDYATVAFVWDKVDVTPGYYTVTQCEMCLVFKRGRIPTPRGSRQERQLVVQSRGEHSAKPGTVRARIERMFPQHPRIELFARREACADWDTWGLETGGRLKTSTQNEAARPPRWGTRTDGRLFEDSL